MEKVLRTRPINILVVEDDHYLRAITAETLIKNRFNVVGSSANARQAMALAKNIKIDIAILDIDLGGGPTGIDLAHALANLHHNLGFIFLTSYKDPRFAALDIPDVPLRSAYLVKQSLNDVKILIETINDVHQKLISNKFWQVGGFTDQREKRNFTNVQIELMQFVAEGLSNSQIALQKSISIKSVETAISRLAKKLDIPNTYENSQRVIIARKYYALIGK